MGPDAPTTEIAGADVDRARVIDVCERYGIAELAVFGSVARGEAGPENDLDLLYVPADGRHLGFSINRLEDELSDLCGRRVDLVSKAGLHRMIRDDVLAGPRALCRVTLCCWQRLGSILQRTRGCNF